MGLPKLILRTVNKYLKGLEKLCQSLVTVTLTQKKRKIDCSLVNKKCKNLTGIFSIFCHMSKNNVIMQAKQAGTYVVE